MVILFCFRKARTSVTSTNMLTCCARRVTTLGDGHLLALLVDERPARVAGIDWVGRSDHFCLEVKDLAPAADAMLLDADRIGPCPQ